MKLDKMIFNELFYIKKKELAPLLEMLVRKQSQPCKKTSDKVKHNLLNGLRMKEDILLVRYLGVPLISFRLSSANCGVLLDKIIGRIGSWFSRKLLCRQASVAFFCFIHLASLLDMYLHHPKKIVKAIEQKFNRFLWNGKDVEPAKAKKQKRLGPMFDFLRKRVVWG